MIIKSKRVESRFFQVLRTLGDIADFLEFHEEDIDVDGITLKEVVHIRENMTNFYAAYLRDALSEDEVMAYFNECLGFMGIFKFALGI